MLPFAPQKDANNLDCGNSLPLCLAAHGIFWGTMTAHNELWKRACRGALNGKRR